MSIDIRSARVLDEPDQINLARLLANFGYVASTGCWNWLGPKTHKGYGLHGYLGRNRAAHRLLYELLIAPIPRELTCDHLCRNTSCINPQHIEIVTNRENILRGDTLAAANIAKTHCLNGHELVGDNIYAARLPHRQCKICARARARRHDLRKRVI